MAIPCRKK